MGRVRRPPAPARVGHLRDDHRARADSDAHRQGLRATEGLRRGLSRYASAVPRLRNL